MTVTLDEELCKQARELVGPGMDDQTLLTQALQTYVEVQHRRWKAVHSGETDLVADVPRRSLAEVLAAIPVAGENEDADAWLEPTMRLIKKP